MTEFQARQDDGLNVAFNVECDVAREPREPRELRAAPALPCSLRAASAFFSVSDVTLGRWARALAEHGVQVLNKAGELTERGYEILVGYSAARTEGVSLAEYAASIAPAPSPSAALAVADAELIPDAGSHLARFAQKQQANQGRLASLLSTVESLAQSERQLAEIQDAAIRTQAQNDALREIEIYLAEKQRIKNAMLRKLAESALEAEQ